MKQKEIILEFINWYNERHPENYIPNSRLGNYLQDVALQELVYCECKSRTTFYRDKEDNDICYDCDLMIKQ